MQAGPPKGKALSDLRSGAMVALTPAPLTRRGFGFWKSRASFTLSKEAARCGPSTARPVLYTDRYLRRPPRAVHS